MEKYYGQKNCDTFALDRNFGRYDTNGSLLTDKAFITETSTGNINVPKFIVGGRCEITTGTGNIKMAISGS